MKIRRVGAELFHPDGEKDGRTDMTKLFAILRTRLKMQATAKQARFIRMRFIPTKINISVSSHSHVVLDKTTGGWLLNKETSFGDVLY
jgi:hypothetical protein